MNRNRLIGTAVAALVLFLFISAAWSIFEIYPVTRHIPPSAEARANGYLAFDRWLSSMGIPFRTETRGSVSLISGAEEKHIFIHASRFLWSSGAVDYLVRWVEDGGDLFLSMDGFRGDGYSDSLEIFPLLARFGIGAGIGYPAATAHDSDPAFPSYDMNVSFDFTGDTGALSLALQDQDNVTRLVQVTRGKGKFTVTGLPYFLLSGNLGSAPNSRLALALFADSGGGSLLFVRGAARVRGLLGSVFAEGNAAVLLVSILVLISVSFWAVIPRFGLARADAETRGKPLRERFLAEGLFLKQYGALDFYRGLYIKEIKRRLARKEGLSTDDEIYSRIMDFCNKQEGKKNSRMPGKISGREPFPYREFPEIISTLKTILERI